MGYTNLCSNNSATGYVGTVILVTDHAKISRVFSLLELGSQQWKQPITLLFLPMPLVTTLPNLHPPALEEWAKSRRVKTSVSSDQHHDFKDTSIKIHHSFSIPNNIICGTLFLHSRESLFCLNKCKWRQWSPSSLTAFVMFSTSQVPILCWSRVTRQNTCSYKTEAYDGRTIPTAWASHGFQNCFYFKIWFDSSFDVAKGLSQDPQTSWIAALHLNSLTLSFWMTHKPPVIT